MSTGTMDQVGVQVTDWNIVERVARELDALTRHTGPQGPCVHLVSAHHDRDNSYFNLWGFCVSV